LSNLIEPRTLKGFQDFLPQRMMPREEVLHIARRVCRSYGFPPIDTPALEYSEILLANVEEGAEIKKQLYRFRDAGDRDVALRFDLTVPLARFTAQHLNELGMPFKRYQMGTVWRGESPQAGRYREFMQCDFDIIGTTSNAADIEIALVICELLEALRGHFGFDGFQVRVNSRLVLNGLLAELGLADKTVPVLRALDKLPKIGRDKVREEMAKEAGLSAEQGGRVIELVEKSTGSNVEILNRLEKQFANTESALRGVRNLRELCHVAEQAEVPDDRIRVDLSICRGLDYYTGTVYETFLTDLPGIGSICSGGRYDNLTGRYTRQALPGVGASLGLDRFLAAMEELKKLPHESTPAPVLMTQFVAERLGDYQRIARQLRAAGIGVEVFPDAKRIGQQLQYAERRGFRIALIAGPDEFTRGQWKVKNLAARTEEAISEAELVDIVRRRLNAA
jgi:histidyl-tRNA synthetase